MEQAQAHVVAQVPVAELAQVQLQELALELQLERELPVIRVPELELVQEPLQTLKQARRPELAAILKQARELRVSR